MSVDPLGLIVTLVATIVIAVVLFVATASATLGLALLAATNGPFTHAFSAQRGADVTVTANTARASNAVFPTPDGPIITSGARASASAR